MANRLRTDLPKQAVYVIWSQDGKLVYVGSSLNLPGRYEHHMVALRLGGRFELIYDMTGASRREVIAKEDEVIIELRNRGIAVVNPTNREIASARGKAHWVLLRSMPEKEQKERRRKLLEARWNLGPEERSQILKNSWLSRKAGNDS